MRGTRWAPVGAVAAMLVVAACNDLGTPPVTLDDVPGIDVAVGDINGDGLADLVSAGWYRGPNQPGLVRSDYAVSISDGGGQFTVTPVDEDQDFDTETTKVELADIDADGDLDLLRAYEHVVNGIFDEDLAISRGDGAGHFGPPEIVDNPAIVDRVHAITTGDIDADGALDVVLAGTHPAAVHVYLGDGTGDVLPPTTVPAAGTGDAIVTAVTDVVVTDLDGVGGPEIVASVEACVPSADPPTRDCGGEYEAVAGTARFSGPPAWMFDLVSFAGANHDGVGAVAVADIDEDGHDDVVLTASSAVLVDFATQSGMVVRSPNIGRCPSLRGLAVTDVDGDGHPDVAVMGSCEEGAVLFGDGLGDLGSPRKLAFGINPNLGATNALVAGDVTGDGRDDLAVSASTCPCNDSRPQIGVMVNAWGD